jgi:hypothetical protein
MMTATRANQYLNTQVRSSTPLELIVLLYDAALRHAVTAREAMARRDIPGRRNAMSKLMAVVGELQHTLDMERGGDIAKQLDDLSPPSDAPGYREELIASKSCFMVLVRAAERGVRPLLPTEVASAPLEMSSAATAR